MDIREEYISSVGEIVPPKASAGEHVTEKDMPKLPFGTAIVCGKSGSGKSLATEQFINWVNFDRVFWVGPTIKSNRALLDRLGDKLDPNDIYEECEPGVIDKIKEKVEQEARDIEEYEKQMQRYRKLMKIIYSNTNHTLFEDALLLDFFR